MANVHEVEDRVEAIKAGPGSKGSLVKIGTTIGGVKIETVEHMEIISDRLARGWIAVPVHCRDRPGTVFALIMQAMEWGMPIMSTINKSYVVTNKGIERIAYESQMIHAVILRNAPLVGRLRHAYIGSGDDRQCSIWGTFVGEKEAHEYTSETLKRLRDARGRNENGIVKGSPLWDARPDVQLFYSTTVQWARMHAPDVILGAYTPDELDDGSAVITPLPTVVDEFKERLKEGRKQWATTNLGGFDAVKVKQQAGMKDIDGEAVEQKEVEDEKRGDVPVADRGAADSEDRGMHADDKGRSAADVGGAASVGRSDVRSKAAKVSGQGEIFPPDDDQKPKTKGKR
jgi:hypothetical protein